MDDLIVRYLTDAELVAARRGGPLEPYGAERTGLPPRRGRTAGDTGRTPWRRPRPDQRGQAPTG